ncbi:hypothetical protein [Haloarcula mannanilytica]|uniref:hypothetical protein n=1 Tax=Haloarcula mannanilytica TaxID=2509225 RepID=UPI0010F6DB8C|nr:hypothetical protein [Haloarcula mannanilytica]
MKRFYLFYVCLATYGAVFGLSAVSAIVAGDSSLPIVLAGIAGLGMVIGSLYEMVTGSTAAFNIGDLAFWAVVVGTVVILFLQVPKLV